MFVLKTLGRLVLGNQESSQLLSIENGSLQLAKGGEKTSGIKLVRREEDGKFALEVQGLSVVLGAKTTLARKSNALSVKEGEKVLFEWRAGADVLGATLDMFQVTVAQCLYEVKTGKAASQASDAEIQQFIHTERQSDDSEDVLFESEEAEFYVFDAETNIFKLKNGKARARITEGFYLKVVSDRADGFMVEHEQKVDPDGTVHTDRPSKSFIWCHFAASGQVLTFSLRFKEASSLMALSNAVGEAIYEILNEGEKVSADASRFLLNPFGGGNEIEMTDAPPLSISDDDEDEVDDERDSTDREVSTSEDEEYSEEERKVGAKGEEKYSNLAVGYKHDRSFVAKGKRIGVFRHTADDRLEHTTDLKIKTKNAEFSPARMMLHQEDSSLLLMNPEDRRHLYKMDLERGEVVETWQVDADRDVNCILPSAKYAQLTMEPTLIGLNDNSLFRIDPRLSGSKRVEGESKTYAVKNKFSCGATTGEGELAVGSAKGEIRLFNALDKRAKSLLPGFGDPILGIDVTDSGRWIIATCKTYLLLINTEMEQTDKNGFQTSMASKGKPPIRLSLKPEHVAYMGAPLNFTPARFSTGAAEERSIITSSGPFVITWSLRRVQQGRLFEYGIKRYEEAVVADGFRYGQEKSIVVALPEYVTMVSKKSLAAPSPKTLKKRN